MEACERWKRENARKRLKQEEQRHKTWKLRIQYGLPIQSIMEHPPPPPFLHPLLLLVMVAQEMGTEPQCWGSPLPQSSTLASINFLSSFLLFFLFPFFITFFCPLIQIINSYLPFPSQYFTQMLRHLWPFCKSAKITLLNQNTFIQSLFPSNLTLLLYFELNDLKY